MTKTSRKDLMTAVIERGAAVSKIIIQEVMMAPGDKAPPHLHPCPTMGVVTQGEVAFQVEGQAAMCLTPGDCFYEPRDEKIVRFENEGHVPAKFVVFYLLADGQDETVQILKT